MVKGEEGWERSAVGVFWTVDGGRTWRPITPPVPDASELRGVYFASRRRGWALAEPGREGSARPSIYSTTDGGSSWRRSRLTAYNEVMPARSVSFSLVGGHELFALARVEGDTASNAGSLMVSHDGGRRWRPLPYPPQAGRIDFESPRRGWLAGGLPGPALWRTVDGGRSWTEVVPEHPRAGRVTPPLKEEFTPLGAGEWISYMPPLIGPDGHGILPTVRSSERHTWSAAIVYATADDGRTWHRSARVFLPHISGSFEAADAYARRGRSRSLLVHDSRTGAITIVSANGRAGATRPSRGQPRGTTSVSLSDRRHGFGYPEFSSHPTLSFTEDGGRNWTHVQTPRAPPWPESLAPAAIAGPRHIHRSPAARGREPGTGRGPAGVCPAAKGPTVVAYLSSGVPIVPCWLVSPRQRLEVVNVTGGKEEPGGARPETVDLAGFHARLAPGQAVLLDEPIGRYLGPGSHLFGGVTAVEIRLDHTERCNAPKPPPCPAGP
jgi:photosystem II stability/assembly factor-like uncharacterized protein